MATITIDGRQHDVETLSAEARQQIVNIKAVDQEIAKLQIQMAIAQTARATYSNILRSALSQAPGRDFSKTLEEAIAAGESLNLG